MSEPEGHLGPIDIHKKFGFVKMGLHVMDMQIPQGDLIAMIERRAEVAQTQKPR